MRNPANGLRVIISMQPVFDSALNVRPPDAAMRIGRCEICGKRKTNLTDHHLAEWGLSGVMMVCQDCHVFVNQFREALAKARKLQGAT